MKAMDPASGRSGCEGLTGEALERHFFACADCRGQTRLAAAWEALREEPPGDGTDAAGQERFVEGVLAAVRRDGSRRRLRRLWLAAAAVLLFFFAAGANFADRAAAPPSPEEEYAGLAAPSALEGLLPE
ncbi:MAG: hypothetical protein ACM3SU_00080 [Acidobacteriota bacterium]